jgi:hypothetical protein
MTSRQASEASGAGWNAAAEVPQVSPASQDGTLGYAQGKPFVRQGKPELQGHCTEVQGN